MAKDIEQKIYSLIMHALPSIVFLYDEFPMVAKKILELGVAVHSEILTEDMLMALYEENQQVVMSYHSNMEDISRIIRSGRGA